MHAGRGSPARSPAQNRCHTPYLNVRAHARPGCCPCGLHALVPGAHPCRTVRAGAMRRPWQHRMPHAADTSTSGHAHAVASALGTARRARSHRRSPLRVLLDARGCATRARSISPLRVPRAARCARRVVARRAESKSHTHAANPSRGSRLESQSINRSFTNGQSDE